MLNYSLLNCSKKRFEQHFVFMYVHTHRWQIKKSWNLEQISREEWQTAWRTSFSAVWGGLKNLNKCFSPSSCTIGPALISVSAVKNLSDGSNQFSAVSLPPCWKTHDWCEFLQSFSKLLTEHKLLFLCNNESWLQSHRLYSHSLNINKKFVLL